MPPFSGQNAECVLPSVPLCAADVEFLKRAVLFEGENEGAEAEGCLFAAVHGNLQERDPLAMEKENLALFNFHIIVH